MHVAAGAEKRAGIKQRFGHRGRRLGDMACQRPCGGARRQDGCVDVVLQAQRDAAEDLPGLAGSIDLAGGLHQLVPVVRLRDREVEKVDILMWHFPSACGVGPRDMMRMAEAGFLSSVMRIFQLSA